MATEDDEYEQIYVFLNNHCYPEGCEKVQKRALRRKAGSYMVGNGLLFHRKAKTDEWKQVPRCGKERSRILEACHSLPEGISYNF